MRSGSAAKIQLTFVTTATQWLIVPKICATPGLYRQRAEDESFQEIVVVCAKVLVMCR